MPKTLFVQRIDRPNDYYIEFRQSSRTTRTPYRQVHLTRRFVHVMHTYCCDYNCILIISTILCWDEKRTRVGHVVHAVISAFVLVQPEQQDHASQQYGGGYECHVQRHIGLHYRFGSS